MNLLDLLNKELNKNNFSISESDILAFSRNAPKKYKIYSIMRVQESLLTHLKN